MKINESAMVCIVIKIIIVQYHLKFHKHPTLKFCYLVSKCVLQKVTHASIKRHNALHFQACDCYISVGINTCKYVFEQINI